MCHFKHSPWWRRLNWTWKDTFDGKKKMEGDMKCLEIRGRAMIRDCLRRRASFHVWWKVLHQLSHQENHAYNIHAQKHRGHDPPDNITIIIFYLINILSLKEKHYRKGKKSDDKHTHRETHTRELFKCYRGL